MPSIKNKPENINPKNDKSICGQANLFTKSPKNHEAKINLEISKENFPTSSFCLFEKFVRALVNLIAVRIL